MSFAKGIRTFYRVTALAASSELRGIAINALKKASCKHYIAILPIETERKSSVKETDIQRQSFSNKNYTPIKSTNRKEQLLLKQYPGRN